MRSFERCGWPGAVPYYVSLVDEVLMRHATWPECERRVNKVRRALHKKVKTKAEEVAILRGWGVKSGQF